MSSLEHSVTWDFEQCFRLKAKSFPLRYALAKRSRKKTQVENLALLATPFGQPCVHLRWLAMTCAHFGRDQICTQVKARFSPIGHPTQVNASWVTSINLLLANEIQDMSALKWVFCDLRVLVRKLASPFGHPAQASFLVMTGHYEIFSRFNGSLELWVKLRARGRKQQKMDKVQLYCQ